MKPRHKVSKSSIETPNGEKSSPIIYPASEYYQKKERSPFYLKQGPMTPLTPQTIEMVPKRGAVQKDERSIDVYYKVGDHSNVPLNTALNTEEGVERQETIESCISDPNMSPLSKDLLRLTKLITISFKKIGKPPQTNVECYRIGKILGKGAFGKVNLAVHKLSEEFVAIKSINKTFL
jgi:serine/threonine protein kinase